VRFKVSPYLMVEGEMYVPAGKRTPVILTGVCYVIFNKIHYSVLTQLQYIRLVATYFVFYKIIFRPVLNIGRYIQCVHTLWDPIVFTSKIFM